MRIEDTCLVPITVLWVQTLSYCELENDRVDIKFGDVYVKRRMTILASENESYGPYF